ncbi:ABC transporter permease [Paenibacillus thalictri]|uniref:Sugar ABC transporter permease n=1 Tax=Paenibacillus thalictri TaxID=2527873 RepID=A0A4Q9DHL3_9BACL|nr:ABC transporter permease subunit [Paenibacillus thalictri]TBL72393.1 sugar ABC transporter permease [Paenibacillus thalictri]
MSNSTLNTLPERPASRRTRRGIDWKSFTRNYDLYLMLVPVLIYYIIFQLQPIYGLQIAFKDFSASLGIWDSPWAGFTHFERFFSSYYFGRLIGNTIEISLYALAVGFPMPIMLALLLNEIQLMKLKKFVQNVTYFPHFVSVIVVAGMINVFTSPDGFVTTIMSWFGGEKASLLTNPDYFKTIYVISNVWQHTGWSAIIYIAALAGINPELYEAATMDGASRWKKIIYVSIPGIFSTIVVLFILQIGSLLDVGFQKILLLQNPLNLEASDVISTYVYRTGILQGNYSLSTAVGLFNTLINVTLLVIANTVIKRLTNNSLW